MTSFQAIMELTGIAVDFVGVLVVVLVAIYAPTRFLKNVFNRQPASYRSFRQDLGRAILLGLELLVAGDIIRTVAVSPSLENVIVLALIVLIRTFLSFALELELEGRWPWQPRPAP